LQVYKTIHIFAYNLKPNNMKIQTKDITKEQMKEHIFALMLNHNYWVKEINPDLCLDYGITETDTKFVINFVWVLSTEDVLVDEETNSYDVKETKGEDSFTLLKSEPYSKLIKYVEDSLNLITK